MNTEWVQLKAEDGNELAAYVVRPDGEPKGALVVVQEIFGVNRQIQKSTEEWASHGYLCIAPAMFDRIEKNVNLEYNQEDFQKGFGLMKQFSEGLVDQTKDVKAAVEWLRAETDAPVGVVGYCFGGTMAFLSATRLEIDAAAGYYGGAIAQFANEEPQCPVILHFGADDEYIPQAARDTIQTAHPEVPIFVYEGAGHAFERSVDPNHYRAEAATLANKRTLLFLEQHFG
ncbi:dienelactone hydrolase family protein [Terriglobus aquaticus]|uniref:Dienelactone hydrolase family protein n=1 Tax=Terriglobus aquaticus TaxID=940139 RepID=A0ABW9KPJ9_9BACT|nr:dienelactone hydrolase family protein [Terriglobus aquaticus]